TAGARRETAQVELRQILRGETGQRYRAGVADAHLELTAVGLQPAATGDIERGTRGNRRDAARQRYFTALNRRRHLQRGVSEIIDPHAADVDDCTGPEPKIWAAQNNLAAGRTNPAIDREGASTDRTRESRFERRLRREIEADILLKRYAHNGIEPQSPHAGA